MGKPYIKELAGLSETYEWSMGFNVDSLASSISDTAPYSLLATGSGGSLTAAHFAASLHQKYSGKIAKPVTPLELASSLLNTRDVSVLMLSAGGKNKDIIGAFNRAVRDEPKSLIVLSGRGNSPLALLAHDYRYVDLIVCDLPAGRDGFLATNSLLAFVVLLYRAWAAAFCLKTSLPTHLEGFIDEALILKLVSECEPIWRRENLSVLYGPASHSAALDLESKFTEAALGAVQIADYRNFAHGRHHWLAKRADTTGVLAFITKDDQEIAVRTLRQIPPEIPVARIEIPYGGTKAGIAAIIAALHITGSAGQARHIDPGRPGVPRFGSNIYRLNAFASRSSSDPINETERIAIERKTATRIATLRDRGEIDFWSTAYHTFTDRLAHATFNALVLDYDGTLCDGVDRYKGLTEGVLDPLLSLLRSGLTVGIATGRGSSVRKVLRAALPKKFWKRVLVGYYNGAEHGLLSSDDYPDPKQEMCGELSAILEALKSDTIWPGLSGATSKITYKRKQITFQIEPKALLVTIWSNLQQALHRLDACGIEVLCSTHSVDVVAPGVSKQITVERVQEMVGGREDTAVLCIGDRGRWPGNDFALLNGNHSLSVDEVSPNPESCWNLAAPGHRGVQATIDYLRALNYRPNKGAKLVFPLNGICKRHESGTGLKSS